MLRKEIFLKIVMSKKMIKKKVAEVIAFRANYGRCKTLLASIKEHKSLELILIVCGSALLDKFGKTSNIIKQDGFGSILSAIICLLVLI